MWPITDKRIMCRGLVSERIRNYITIDQPSEQVHRIATNADGKGLPLLPGFQGPVDGLMGPQTLAAIQDLQRQAGLPQTGQMNAATQAALANYLAHGNNQMGGNS